MSHILMPLKWVNCIASELMIHILTPPGCDNERRYALDIIFGEWLDIQYRHIQSERDDTCIHFSDQVGKICLPDTFFGQFKSQPDSWMKQESLANLPLSIWNSLELASDILLTKPKVPVLFGDENLGVHRIDTVEGKHIRLPIDVIGATFFMLSRYEEAVLPERDNHKRFPASASLAFRGGFLDRPIIDEYVEILWRAMRLLWPSIKRKIHQARILVSCDVDRPYAFNAKPNYRFARILAGDLLKRRSFKLAWRKCCGIWQARRGDYSLDPHRCGLEYIMASNERVGRSVFFYFIPENTDVQHDNRVSLDDPLMRSLLREIHIRGHEIGIHPGYNTYQHPEAMARSVATLRRVLDEEGINQPRLGGRQHFLRWETPTTARLWNDNGLDYDSTLGFADRPGFRCGTCREYTMYDLGRRLPLNLRERPLIVMECSVFDSRYLNMVYSEETLALMMSYKNMCLKFSGNFTLLWHNNNLSTTPNKRFYSTLIQ